MAEYGANDMATKMEVLKHDVNRLATSLKDNSAKLDKLVDKMNLQTTILERLTNIDKNTAESFERAFSRIDHLYQIQETEGCKSLAVGMDELRTNVSSSMNSRLYGVMAIVTTILIAIFSVFWTDISKLEKKTSELEAIQHTNTTLIDLFGKE